MLNDKDLMTLQEFARQVRAAFPSAQLWAFGSRVRGEDTGESDLDVCVVLESIDPAIRARISELAWEVGFERETLISTVVFSKEMFERGRCSVSSLVHTIREEGIAA